MHEHRFDPARAARLHDEKRARELPLALLFERLGDLAGQRWADLGAGTGYATLPLAAAVGPTGRVWAIDAEPRMLAFLEERRSAVAASQVQTLCATAEAMPLPDSSLDGALAVTSWHELDDRVAALARCRRALRQAGRLVLVDWLHAADAWAELPEVGPPADHRLRLTTVVDELATAGFNVVLHRDCYLAHYVAIGHKE